MFNYYLIAALLVMSAGFAGILIYAGRLWREYSEAKRQLQAFLSPAGEGEPSPFAKLVSDIGITLGNQVAIQAKTTIMGMMSGISKQANRLQEDLLESEHPGMKSLMKSLPGGLGKSVIKNPILAAIASQIVGRMMPNQGGDNGQNPAGVAGGEPTFKL